MHFEAPDGEGHGPGSNVRCHVRVELTDAELLLRGSLQRRDAIDRAVVVVAVEQEHQRPALHRVVVEGELEVPDKPLHLLR